MADSPSQQPWKAPVADWVRDVYDKRQRRIEQERRRRERALEQASPELTAPAPSSAPAPATAR